MLGNDREWFPPFRLVSGFAGRLITRYLFNHPQRGSFTLGVGVRSEAKGEALRKALGFDETVLVIQVDAGQYEQVEAVVKGAKVVISAVGPYWTCGEAIAKACAEHGKKYVDLTGEPHFVRRVIDLYDEIAMKTGAVLVPACGLESLPSDILVHLSNETLKTALGPSAELGLSESFWSVKFNYAFGSMALLRGAYEEAPRVKVKEAAREYALSPVRGVPSPSVRGPRRVPFSQPPAYGTYFLMGIINRAIVQRTFGLNQIARIGAKSPPSETCADMDDKLRSLDYGPTFRYVEYLADEDRGFCAALYFGVSILTYVVLLTLSPFRWYYKKFSAKPGQGPSNAALENGSFTVTNYTVSASAPLTRAKSTVRGTGNPGYLLTSVMAGESALCLLLDEDSLPVMTRRGGVLTPATAFGRAIVRRLEQSGRMRFETEIVDQDEGGKQR
ncbi:hypothetical protein PYCCODRAFT_1249358 [Trametes coccinea BRFM310]|uniref:Saccharopine dehydrogenase NADP binding domain-containing protein n=1 Tax=Trametes coccinea (strain BRFM310) TaxID=1353009 RepID=A0A1Y2I6J7_TRAC3|nr:hypothetical protein PYCCODRAFT_1249358 [Trametes coccinea BRFM310]